MQRLVVHPAEHQHLAGVVLLGNGRDQAGRIPFQPCRDGGVKHRSLFHRVFSQRSNAAYDQQVSYSSEERLALCALLDKTGPDAPTLCEGWTTGDLAAHLVLRERRPDAAAGVMGGPLAGYTARVQQRIRARTPFADLVRTIRSGPPRLSVMALPGMDERTNAVEFFVHHEDVRRAAPGWEPRELASGESDMLWHRLRMARFMLRKAPVGVELARDDIVLGNRTARPTGSRRRTQPPRSPSSAARPSSPCG